MVNKLLSHKERALIFQQFLNDYRLKFNEIEKKVKIPSNKVAYHLNSMQKDLLLEKKGDHYQLTKNAEKYIPLFSQIDESVPLSIALVCVVNGNKLLMMKRNKRPYKGCWAMIGGKILLQESLKDASIRLVKEKSFLDCGFKSQNAIMNEKVFDKENNGLIHNFFLFFTKVEVDKTKFRESSSGELKWFTLKELEKEKVVPSDIYFLQNKFNSKLTMKTLHIIENEGNLESFKFI